MLVTEERRAKRGHNMNPERYRMFAEAFCGAARGNATKAAEMAGYLDGDNAGVRLMRRHDVQKMIAELRVPLEERNVMSREELLGWLSSVIRDVRKEHPLKERISAAQLFAKCTGNVIDRAQIELMAREQNGRALTVDVIEVDTATQALRLIRAEQEVSNGDE